MLLEGICKLIVVFMKINFLTVVVVVELVVCTGKYGQM